MEQERIKNPVMEYYRYVYRFSKRWNGRDELTGKHVILYCEQGFGDIIQFLRYIAPLKERGCKVTLHCPVELHPLLPYVKGIDEYFDKQHSILPEHDYHILSLSLPFLLGINDIPPEPYIDFKEKADLGEFSDGIKIGIAWEGSPEHPRNLDRCCHLSHFKDLIEENTHLFMLQNKIYLESLVEDVDIPIYSIPIKDFKDTASLINAMDFVVTVDTSVLHLAGALGKRTYGILGNEADPRWKVGNWYESVSLLEMDWKLAMNIVRHCRKR